MQPTAKQLQLSKTIDTWVKSIEKRGGDDIEILQDGLAYMTTFKEILDTTMPGQMDNLCEIYPGFYRFAKLLEDLAQGIHDGTINVPPVD